MKRGDVTGIQGIPTQDMAMWESMGPIADRTREHLGSSDLAIIQFRRQMIEAARRFQAERLTFGAGQDRPAFVDLASFEGLAPKTADWRTLVSASKAEKVPAL